jgi:hypothetical protein
MDTAFSSGNLMPRTRTNTSIAPTKSTDPRWSIVNAELPVKSGVKPEPHSGHDRQAFSAPLATTVEPVNKSR